MEEVKKGKSKALLIGSIVGIFVSILYGCNLLNGLEWQMYDMRFCFRGELATDERIVIVAVDEQSLKEIGRWPWNRSSHAELINELSQAGARTIGMDILFAEPDMRNPSEDRKLTAATKAAKSIVYLVTYDSIGEEMRWIEPFPELADSAAGLGHGNVIPSADGVVRQVGLAQDIRGERFFAFGLELVRNYLKAEKIIELKNAFAVGNLRVPKEIMYINFASTRVKQISYYKVLRGEFPANYFQDKIVLVGCTARGMGDEKLTPFSKYAGISNGVVVQANIINTILNGNYIVPLNKIAVILIILILGLVIALFIKGERIMYNTIIAVVILLGIIHISFLLFTYLHIHLPIVPFLLTVPLVFMWIVIEKIFTVEHKLHQKLVEFFKGSQKKTGMEEAIETIAKLTRELNVTNKQLQEATEAKSRFLANMSHELRTPLNSIIGFSEILLAKTFGELNEKQTKYANNIHTSGKHLLTLVNDILDLSKVEAGKIELTIEEIPLKETLSECETLVKTLASKKNLLLEFKVEGISTVHTDPTRFKQIMYNLLSNAIKFTPEGGRINVNARPVDEMVQISVQDTGIGIAEKDQQRVFEEFEQVDSAYSRQYAGTGLGLPLTKKLIELHKGRIWLESEVGKGSTFTFTIPLRTEKTSVIEEVSAPSVK